MKPNMSTHTVKRLGTLLLASVLIIGVVSAVPFSALAQDGVETPTPSGDSDDPYDCGDFDNRAQVEAVFEAEEDDTSDLDRDDDGIPCESIGKPTDTEIDTETESPTEESEDTETPTEKPTENQTDTPSDDKQTDDADKEDTTDNDTTDSKDTEDKQDSEETTDTEEEKPPC